MCRCRQRSLWSEHAVRVKKCTAGQKICREVRERGSKHNKGKKRVRLAFSGGFPSKFAYLPNDSVGSARMILSSGAVWDRTSTGIGKTMKDALCGV